MLRKALTLGMAFILVLSLLLVSMITCFTYDAEADHKWWCYNHETECVQIADAPKPDPWCCHLINHHETGE